MRLNSRLKQAVITCTFILCATVIPASLAAQVEIDEALTDYQVAGGISGNLSSAGSDTLANLMTLWAEQFKRAYPHINIQIQAAGSSSAPPALTEATVNLGPMSRKMKDREVAAFETRHGYKPTAVAVALDALAIYVHRDNPIQGMSLSDIDAIFSSTRKCGAIEDISGWGQLNMDGPWSNRGFQLFGRNSVSGTYGFFKNKALCKGDFKNSVNEQPGSASVVQSVSNSINAVGYSGIGYNTASVRAIPLRASKNQDFVTANEENALRGTYPLSRLLYIYVNKAPNRPLAPLEREFFKFVLSRQGQSIVVRDGYIPLPARAVEQSWDQLGL